METRISRIVPALIAFGFVNFSVLISIHGTNAQAQSGADYSADSLKISKLTATFEDVPFTHWAYEYIEELYSQGFISGCSSNPLLYCPEKALTRAEMAVFVVRGVHGAGYIPPQPTQQIFADVPIAAWYAKWVHQLWNDGYTDGCGTNPLIFCPERAHTRAEATVFFLRMFRGKDYIPPDAQGIFVDVPTSQWYAKWVESAYDAGLIPACQLGLGRKRFCPEAPLNRAMAAFMMVLAKGLLTPKADLTATELGDGLEVTQGIQDLRNSVRLVEGKETYVRFHVHSKGGAYPTETRLCVQRGNELVDWIEATEEPSEVIEHPSRRNRKESFIFKLPRHYTSGTITLTGYVNAPTASRGYAPLETDYANNAHSAVNLTFERVPRVNIVIYRMGYEYEGQPYWPDPSHVEKLKHWLKQAFPMESVKFFDRDYLHRPTVVKLPTCRTVNLVLTRIRIADRLTNVVPPDTRYYGMWDDGAFDMRPTACAKDFVASGPAGTPQGIEAWDLDGSYGDWLGGHELAHTFGFDHAPFCGTPPPVDDDYPYPDGNISPTLAGADAIFGFNFDDHTDYEGIYSPDWKDVMTYCPYRWISDTNYVALMNHFQVHLGPGFVDPGEQNKTDRLLVVGTLDSLAGLVELQPLFVYPNMGEIEPRTPGEYAIVLRDAANAELARYAFTPEDAADIELSGISELVPYVEGTTQVDIEGPADVLASVAAGAAKPTVTITSPDSVASTTEDTVTVSWIADDTDGDSLVFQVEFNSGKVWQTVALNLTSTSLKVDVSELTPGTQGGFRIWVSDGIHTAMDESTYLMTGVENRGSQLPDGFLLMQNYPNPFNAETIIRYKIPHNSLVNLSVFNLLGQKVHTLVDDELSAGFHETRWNGTDALGSPVTSGVYLYRLTVGEFSYSKKMLYLR